MAINYVDSTFIPKYDPTLGMGNLGSIAYGAAPRSIQPSAFIPGQLGNSDYASPTTSSILSTPTTPMSAPYVSYAPNIAAPVDLSNLSQYMQPTPTSFDATSSALSKGYAGGSLDLSNPMSSFGSSLTSKINAASSSSPSWFSSLGDFASKNKGLIHDVSGLAQAGLGAFNAWNSNQVAKDQLKFQKEAFGKQYEAQKGLTNSQLADRQRRRVAEQPNLALGVDEYMNKYGVK